MRPLLALVLLLQAFHIDLAHATERYLELVVTQPYLEMHSGPGRGFPVVYVVGRDELVTVLYSRTEWYKVRAPRGLGAHHARVRRARAHTPLSGLLDPPLGSRRRLRRL